jgi:DNA invertase Pin-like site-specific DNA recombinase
LRRMLDAAAEYERGLIRVRTRAALAVKRARGERTGTVPYGYRLAPDRRTLEPDAYEQEVLAFVRAARTRDRSLREIVVDLAAAGHRSRVGTPFGLTQVAQMERSTRAR